MKAKCSWSAHVLHIQYGLLALLPIPGFLKCNISAGSLVYTSSNNHRYTHLKDQNLSFHLKIGHRYFYTIEESQRMIKIYTSAKSCAVS